MYEHNEYNVKQEQNQIIHLQKQITKWKNNPIKFIEDMGIKLKWYQKIMLKYRR